MIKLDIMSDPICPWCYIGKTHLEKALAEHPDHPFTVEWHPFQLNPDMPAEGMDRRVYLERKFGGKEAAIKVYSQIEQTAEALGLPIDFAAMKHTPQYHRCPSPYSLGRVGAKAKCGGGCAVSSLFLHGYRHRQPRGVVRHCRGDWPGTRCHRPAFVERCRPRGDPRA